MIAITGRTKTVLLLGAVLLAAALPRFLALETRVLWFDEAVSLLIARADPSAAIVAAQDDPHPPLYNALLHFWTQWLPGEYGARLLSAVPGTLTVLVVFAIGYRLGGRKAATAAALLLAICPLHVWYSQEVRMYAVQTLWISLSWWLLLRAIEKRDTGSWLCYTLATAAALYTQYTSLYALAAQNLYVVITRRRTQLPWRMWWRSQGAVAILFLPWLPMLWHHLHMGNFGYWLGPLKWGDPFRFFGLLSGAIPRNPGPYWPWVMVTGLALTAALLNRRVWFLLLWLFVPVIGLTAQSLANNVFLPRSLMFVTPALALIVGCGYAANRRRRLALGGITLLAGANLFGLAQYYFLPNPWIRSELRAAATKLAGEVGRNDLVLHASRFSYRPFQCYLEPTVTQAVEQETDRMPALFGVIGLRALPPAGKSFPRVWVVWQADFQRPDAGAQIRSWLRTGYDPGTEFYRAAQFRITRHDRRLASTTNAP